MPIFHFNLANDHYDADTEGTELASPDEARIQAVIFAGSHLRDNPGLIWDGQRFEVQVTDESGARLFTVAVETINS